MPTGFLLPTGFSAQGPLRLVSLLALAALPIPALAADIASPDTVAAASAADRAWLAAVTVRPITDLPARLRSAVDALPVVGEGREGVNVAEAQTTQARSRLFPVLGLDLQTADTVARSFERPATIFESLIPRRRTDAIGSINQLLVDWGATSARVRAGRLGEDAAEANLQQARLDAAVAVIAAWHDAIAAHHALALGEAHVERLQRIADGVKARTEAGADSAADEARAATAAAQGRARLADLRRRQAAAQARLVELFGSNPPEPARAGLPENEPTITDLPEVMAARADAQSRREAARAAGADRMPRFDARVTGSSFDLLRGGRPDYDVRALVSMTARFSTGGAEAARVAELNASARRARYLAQRLELENARELAEAEAQTRALAEALPAQHAAFDDATRARDLFAVRFAAARGTLFDLLIAEREQFEAGLQLVDAELRTDVARWLLLARRGTLLQQLDSGSSTAGGRPLTPR
jgi:adhesin transport system outer membrane protein